MKAGRVRKHLAMLEGTRSGTFFSSLPGRLIPGSPDGFFDLQGTSLTEEQSALLKGTVLHSLTEPGREMFIRITHEDASIEDYLIPPVEIGGLEPKAIYADAECTILKGTRIRLPGVHTSANAIFEFQQNNGFVNKKGVRSLILSNCADMTRDVDTKILRCRRSPGASGPAIGGDSFLKLGQIALTVGLANELLDSLILNLPYEKGAMLREKIRHYGPGILHGYQMICQRDPATVYGAACKKSISVCDSPGYAIYIRSEDIDSAGGDFDGDVLRIYEPEDLSGNALFDYLMGNTGYILHKVEDFTEGTISCIKKVRRSMTISNSYWEPEDELKIMGEFQQRGLIGRTWYCMVQYKYLFAHHLGSNKLRAIKYRLSLIRQFVESEDKPDTPAVRGVVQVYNWFMNKYPTLTKTLVGVDEFIRDWTHLAYVCVACSFFVLYEAIFDMRKGDSNLSYHPSDVLSSLTGFTEKVNWEGMRKGGIWIEPLQTIYDLLPTNERGQVDFAGAMSEHPAFFGLVTRRRNLTSARQFRSIQELVPYMDKPDFAQWLINQLLLGK